jgi:hypothetical protein
MGIRNMFKTQDAQGLEDRAALLLGYRHVGPEALKYIFLNAQFPTWPFSPLVLFTECVCPGT